MPRQGRAADYQAPDLQDEIHAPHFGQLWPHIGLLYRIAGRNCKPRSGSGSPWLTIRNPATVSTRATSCAEENDDHTDGISAIGIAFRNPAGETFAISVPIPTPRFADQRHAVIAALLRLKSRLAQGLPG